MKGADLNSSCPAFVDSLGYVRSWWVKKRHEANETKILAWEVHGICVKGVALGECFGVQYLVCKTALEQSGVQLMSYISNVI